MAILIYSMFALLVLTHTAHGSGVVLQQNPDVIQTILTQEMTMQCSINDTGVGQDLRFVTSLIISRNGTEVASITPFSPLVDSHVDMGKMNASGSVSMQGGVQGYLRLTWTYPDAGQAGDYTCEVNGVNSVGHPISYTTTVNIPVREPTLSDITLLVRDQQIEINKQNVENIELKLSNLKHETDIGSLQSDMTLHKTDLSTLKTQNILMNQKMNEVITVLDETRHIENGTVVYGASTAWTDVGSYMEKNITVDFAMSYAKTPVVHYSLVHINNYNSNAVFKYSLRYWIDLMDVSSDHFMMRVRTEGVSQIHLKFLEFDVDWISLGKPQ